MQSFPVETAEIVLPAADLEGTLAYFTEELGFAVELVRPADQPRIAVVSGFGLRIRFDAGLDGPAGRLRLCSPNANACGEVTAPNGTLIEWVGGEPLIDLPDEDPSFVISRLNTDARWVVGRAGMRYRDLIPGRQGGRFIASHIHIDEAGPVPDYAHYHRVRFQMIFCFRGWARVVYEDQGEPFLLNAGDCVLQPPGIRHRVLESSKGLEVIEIGCPADHETRGDFEIELPTPDQRPDRMFDGQRFVHHVAADAVSEEWRLKGFSMCDFGIGKATQGLAGACVVRSEGGQESMAISHDGEFLFLFLLSGELRLATDHGAVERLESGDCCVIPRGLKYALTQCSDDLEMLEVRLPAELDIQHHAGLVYG